MRLIAAVLTIAGLLGLPAPTPVALPVAAPVAAPRLPQVADGFRIAPAVSGLHHPTRLHFGPDGTLLIAQQTGEVWAVTLADGAEQSRELLLRTGRDLLGVTLHQDRLWVSHTGLVAVYPRGPDGRFGARREIVRGIPHGLHQNNGVIVGPDGRLYFGVGSSTDRGPEAHPWSATIMRVNPDGSGLEIFARGFRNPYGMAFDDDGNLWVTDNGADDPVSADELNLVVQGGHYGYPRHFETPPPGTDTIGPVALFGAHNSTNGLTYYQGGPFPTRYQGGLFVAMWGSSFDQQTGRAVAFVRLARAAGGLQAEVQPFATGFDRPLDVAVGPAGDLYVADFEPGVIYRIWYEGKERVWEPAPADSRPSRFWPMVVAQAAVLAAGLALLIRRSRA